MLFCRFDEGCAAGLELSTNEVTLASMLCAFSRAREVAPAIDFFNKVMVVHKQPASAGLRCTSLKLFAQGGIDDMETPLSALPTFTSFFSESLRVPLALIQIRASLLLLIKFSLRLSQGTYPM